MTDSEPVTDAEPVTRVLLASRNAKKLDELRRILAGTGVPVELVGLDDVPEYPQTPETGLTFEENALLKARAGAQATGLPAVADDSGLAVDALGGMPGVFSARWSGRHGDDAANLDLVLAQLADVPDGHLGAAFVCAAAVAFPDGREFVTHGRQAGRLIRHPRGDGGFGYDPAFVSAGNTRTNAELAPAEKDAISHRGQALRALADVISAHLRAAAEGRGRG
ncbi:MAG: XTP/dITP diphosphohydrolase [Micromonosporaceae bacterium]|jgi:XTP/dITP diphosphohydrolase|nr:XTP/dITP diphosphohydrolase [Micromonosporaceae bacterium]